PVVVRMSDTKRLGQNAQPALISRGRAMKKIRDARTSHRIATARFATRIASPVSQYSQTNAISDVIGSDASAAPSSVLRLETSVTATMTRAETPTLRP